MSSVHSNVTLSHDDELVIYRPVLTVRLRSFDVREVELDDEAYEEAPF